MRVWCPARSAGSPACPTGSSLGVVGYAFSLLSVGVFAEAFRRLRGATGRSGSVAPT